MDQMRLRPEGQVDLWTKCDCAQKLRGCWASASSKNSRTVGPKITQRLCDGAMAIQPLRWHGIVELRDGAIQRRSQDLKTSVALNTRLIISNMLVVNPRTHARI